MAYVFLMLRSHIKETTSLSRCKNYLDSDIQYKFYESKISYSENIIVEIKQIILIIITSKKSMVCKIRFSKYCEAIEHVGLSNN